MAKARSKTTSASTTRSEATSKTRTTTRKTRAAKAEPAAAADRAPKATTKKKRPKKGDRRPIRCYLCGHPFEVSGLTMSTTCPNCHKAIKVEDVQVKSYVPVNDLQTCGTIKIARRGRVAAKNVQSGEGVICEGSIEGSIETDGETLLGPKASWKGKTLQARTLEVKDGATLSGRVVVPWTREAAASGKKAGARKAK